MFVNRIEALKQFVERINNAKQNILIDDFDLSPNIMILFKCKTV